MNRTLARPLDTEPVLDTLVVVDAKTLEPANFIARLEFFETDDTFVIGIYGIHEFFVEIGGGVEQCRVGAV